MNYVHRIDGSPAPPPEVLGGKGHGLARLRSLEVPIPPAFVIGTQACDDFHAAGGVLSQELRRETESAMHWLEGQTSRRFGDGDEPLLVSVRSGAPMSMPGMMDTILNVGLTPRTASGLAAQNSSFEFVDGLWEVWRQSWTVPSIEPVEEEEWGQLWAAIEAVLSSWNSDRACRYRKRNGIPEDAGTAVVIQAMVFGNWDAHSATGVLFSRNPATGVNEPYGEVLWQAQGEQLVGGSATPVSIDHLRQRLPAVWSELLAHAHRIEASERDMQDIEFTIQSADLWILQTRAAKRTGQARLRCAVDMAREGVIDAREALMRVDPATLRDAVPARLDPDALASSNVLAHGHPASPGIATGRVVGEVIEAVAAFAEGETTILARPTTSPEDVDGFMSSAGVVTEHGGTTSHAAVVSRGLGIPCVVGCGDGLLDEIVGKTITIDGSTGLVLEGCVPQMPAAEAMDETVSQLVTWATDVLGVEVMDERSRDPHVPVLVLGDAESAEPALRDGCREHTAVAGAAMNRPENVLLAGELGYQAIYAEDSPATVLAAARLKLASEVR